MMTASMAVLRVAADRREQFLSNIYRMGRDEITQTVDSTFAYLIPPGQWNSGEEISLVNILRTGGIEIQRAKESFTAGNTDYPAGTYVIYTAQAFRPYLVDLMETQEYPDRRSTPGGPPDPPYDLAGWTLPLQMGVQVDRVYSPFQISGETVADNTSAERGILSGTDGAGYLFSHRPNSSVFAANRFLSAGASVSWLDEPVTSDGQPFDTGTYYVESGKGVDRLADALADDRGLNFVAVASKPDVEMSELSVPQVAIYKSWRAGADEGWTRWLLENYSFAPDTLHDADIRSVDLTGYDAIILPSQSASSILLGYAKGSMPDEYTGGLGLEGALALEQYVKQGGRLIAFDAASDFVIDQFGLPVANAVKGLSSRQFFIPGSLIRMDVDTANVLAYGMEEEVAAVFDRSRAFRTLRMPRKREGGVENLPAAPAPKTETVSTYADHDILMSGWALGEESHLGGKAAMMRVKYGDGDVILFGFRPQFRGQPRGTYKLLFNAIQGATVDRD